MNARTTRRRALPAALALAGALLIGAFAQSTAIAQPASTTESTTIETRLTDMEVEFQKAKDADLHLYAPKTFAEAEEKLKDARERYRKGGEIHEIEAELARAREKLGAAEQFAAVGAVVLQDAIAARSDALAAGAPDHAAKSWESAKELLHDSGRDLEKGDHNDARETASQAQERFRKAELEAIRMDLLGAAQQAQMEAQRADAPDKAPRTYATATAALETAETTLQGDRYQRAEAREHAKRAAQMYRHARTIADLSDMVEPDDRQAFEDLQLRQEAAVAEVAAVVGLEPDFAAGLVDEAHTVAAAAKSLKTDRDNLRSELASAGARADSLGSVLASVERREKSATAEMQASRRRDAALRELRDLFDDEQAAVLKQGDEVICRIYGLSFPVGSSEIQPDNFALLTKIQSALRIFPAASVVLEGHTDAAGDDDLNQRLSLQRAEAVRAYVVANMPGAAERISVSGYGEAIPVASNETLDGRARNRRIDIRLTDLFGEDLSGVRYGAEADTTRR